MSEKVLIQFARDYDTRDNAEKVADACLYSLRMMCGRRARVEVVGGAKIQGDEAIAKATRVGWGVFYVLLSGITLPMTLAGIAALKSSDSYSRVYDEYLKGVPPPAAEVRGGIRDANKERALKGRIFEGARMWQRDDIESDPHYESWSEKGERLHREICAYVKSVNSSVKTPWEILWNEEGWYFAKYKPVLDAKNSHSLPSDDVSYALVPQGVLPRADTVSPSGVRIVRHKGSLFLVGDGTAQSEDKIVVDGKCYEGRDGSGPLLKLKKGQDVYFLNGGMLYFLFEVAEDGRYVTPSSHPVKPPHSELGISLALPFLKDASEGAGSYVRPLPKGFFFNSDTLDGKDDTRRIEQLKSGRAPDEDLVFVDEEADPILHDVITYFRRETEIMNYTPIELLYRLTQFCALAFERGGGVRTSFSKNNFYLGSLLLEGMGVCRHRALLLKVLYDAVKKEEDPSLILKCGAPFGCESYFGVVLKWGRSFGGSRLERALKGDRFMKLYQLALCRKDPYFEAGAHVWTQITIESKPWIFDPMLYLARPLGWDDASLALRKKYHLF